MEITKLFLDQYFGAMTNYWIAKHDSEIQEDEYLNPPEFQNYFDYAESLSEKGILWCSLLYLKMSSNISLDAFNRSEGTWSEQGLRNFLEQLIHLYFPNPDTKCLGLARSVVLTDTPLQEWRTTTKPQILAILKAEGIEP